MRYVNRGNVTRPAILTGPAVLTAKAKLGAHLQLPEQTRELRRPPLVPKLWANEQVLGALEKLFQGLCAFCETSVVSAPVNVHHFRPTDGAQDTNQGSLDHYNWFAYEWRNLYLVCQECSREKKRMFPVTGNRAPVLCTWAEAQSVERALLVDPCVDDPEKNFDYFPDGRVVGRTEMGVVTCNILRLNREGLVRARKAKFTDCLNWLKRIRESTDKSVVDSLQQRLSPGREHGGAALAFLLAHFNRVLARADRPRPSPRLPTRDISLLVQTFSKEDWHHVFNRENFKPDVWSESPDAAKEAHEPKYFALSRDTSAARLKSIHIENFKGIEELTINVPGENLGELGAPCISLLGENSTGKSSVLQAVALCLMGDQQRKLLRLNTEDFFHREPHGWKLVGTRRPRVVVEFDQGPPMSLEIDPLTGAFNGSMAPATVVRAYGARRFFGDHAKKPKGIDSIKTLFDSRATISHPSAWLGSLGEREFASVARAMREVLALRQDDEIGRTNDREPFVRAHGRETPFERLSDGYRSLFAMVVDVMRGMSFYWESLEDAYGVVLIDEIETHLHPRWKLRVMSALRAAIPNVQFIVTTHDPLCLRGMRNGEVHVLYRDGQEKVREIEDLPDVRGMRAEQLLTSDFFGLASTSDPGLESALEQLAVHASGQQVGNWDALVRSVLPFEFVGDTPLEQVINEALRRFVRESRDRPGPSRLAVREDAVRAVLDGLETFRAKRPS